MLVVSLIGWVVIATRAQGGDPANVTDSLMLMVIMYVGGRLVGLLHPWAAPAMLAGAAGALALIRFDVLLESPMHSPLGYSNATGSFYFLAAAAALMVAMRTPEGATRQLAVAGTVLFASVPWLNGTNAAAVLSLGLLLPALVRRRPSAARPIILLSAIGLVLTLAGAVTIGASHDERRPERLVDRIVDETLSSVRAELWSDALTMMGDSPSTGVGLGRFGQVSPVAAHEGDLETAHNEFLELGAETGIPGMVIALLLAFWAFVRLAYGPSDPGVVAAAVGVAGLLIHANVDYVLHFPAITAAGALLLGAGASAPGSPTRSAMPVGLARHLPATARRPWEEDDTDRRHR
jgi:O-antigen ligase